MPQHPSPKPRSPRPQLRPKAPPHNGCYTSFRDLGVFSPQRSGFQKEHNNEDSHDDGHYEEDGGSAKEGSAESEQAADTGSLGDDCSSRGERKELMKKGEEGGKRERERAGSMRWIAAFWGGKG